MARETNTRIPMENERVQEFKKLLLNEALVESEPSLAGINPGGFGDIQKGSIYYGTGLSTAKELSIALPFDVLSMVLVSEKIRRALGMKKIYHHIADTHAKSNKLFSDDVVDRRTHDVKETMLRVASNMGLVDFEVMLASDFDTSPEYMEIYQSFGTDKHEYVKREVADMEWYRKQKGVAIKLGWIIQASETELGFDERVFDREYKATIGECLSFMYLKPGRTFDKSRPKVSPYIHVSNETRILLEADEDAKRKIAEAEVRLGDKHLGGARRNLSDIIRLYEKLIQPLGNIPFEDKVQHVIDNVTK